MSGSHTLHHLETIQRLKDFSFCQLRAQNHFKWLLLAYLNVWDVVAVPDVVGKKGVLQVVLHIKVNHVCLVSILWLAGSYQLQWCARVVRQTQSIIPVISGYSAKKRPNTMETKRWRVYFHFLASTQEFCVFLFFFLVFFFFFLKKGNLSPFISQYPFVLFWSFFHQKENRMKNKQIILQHTTKVLPPCASVENCRC